jgi:hypothetical protein
VNTTSMSVTTSTYGYRDRGAAVDFAERAAILEYDHGMTRADAEAQALQEIRDHRLDAGVPGILSELARADRRRRHPDDLGLHWSIPSYGYGHVVADGETYRPALDDEPAHAALIVPAVEDGGVVDLVACTVLPQRMRSRLGVAAVVGLEEIELARETEAPLLVFDNTIRWLLCGNAHGAVIVDWKRAIGELEGVKVIMCSISMATRLHDATRRCWPRPTIAFAQSEKMRHAA